MKYNLIWCLGAIHIKSFKINTFYIRMLMLLIMYIARKIGRNGIDLTKSNFQNKLNPFTDWGVQ